MIIIPIKNRMTSSDANLIRCSRSIVLVIIRIAVPRNAKLNRKLQKKSVPSIEIEKIPIDID